MDWLNKFRSRNSKQDKNVDELRDEQAQIVADLRAKTTVLMREGFERLNALAPDSVKADEELLDSATDAAIDSVRKGMSAGVRMISRHFHQQRTAETPADLRDEAEAMIETANGTLLLFVENGEMTTLSGGLAFSVDPSDKRVSRLAVVTIIRNFADQLEASVASGFGGEQHLRHDGSDVFPEVTVPDAFLRAFSGMEDDEEG